MTQQSPVIHGPVAIKNVAAFMVMTRRLLDRASHLPGLAVCHAPSGYGKTWASVFTQNKTQAIRVEVGESWTKRFFLGAILHEFGETFPKKSSIAELAERVINAMGENPNRPLIVDEADKLVDKGYIELVREIQEASTAPVILIGEEKLPQKLLTVERVHNRVLDWMPAQPCDAEDTRVLARALVPRITVKDDLIDAICAASGGRARRIVVNLDQVREVATNKGISTIDLKLFGGQRFHTGEPPQPRHVQMYAPKARAVA
jgi:DNA transposition AAA+ family ATPase